MDPNVSQSPFFAHIYHDRFTVPTVSQSQHVYWSRQPKVFWRLTLLLLPFASGPNVWHEFIGFILTLEFRASLSWSNIIFQIIDLLSQCGDMVKKSSLSSGTMLHILHPELWSKAIRTWFHGISVDKNICYRIIWIFNPRSILWIMLVVTVKKYCHLDSKDEFQVN